MSGQKGRDILIRIDDGIGGFTTLAGIRTSRLEFEAGTVNATSADSADGWRDLMASAATKSVKISGAGVFKNAASDGRMRDVFFDGEAPQWQFVMPGLGVLQGAFAVTSLSWHGAHDDQAEFSITVESAGPVSFSAQ